MKKKLAVLMVLVMVMGLMVTACSGPGEGKQSEDSGSSTQAEEQEPADTEEQEEAQEENLAEQLEVVYEKIYTMESPTLDYKQAVQLIGVRNNSDKTLDLEFEDTGADKDGKELYSSSLGIGTIQAVGPGETRYFQVSIYLESGSADDIDHMSEAPAAERFTATESAQTACSDQVEITKYTPFDGGVTDIMAKNNSSETVDATATAIYKKDGEPVYFAEVALCNLKDGEIVLLGPGESTELPTLVTDGGNDYDDVEMYVRAYTPAE